MQKVLVDPGFKKGPRHIFNDSSVKKLIFGVKVDSKQETVYKVEVFTTQNKTKIYNNKQT